MKKSIRTILPAMLAGLLAGCAGQTPEMTIDGGSCADPRDEYRARADAYIRDYVPPEDTQPTEYAPELRGTSGYDACAEAARNAYENVSLFVAAKKWKYVSAQYREVSGKSVFHLTAERTDMKLSLEARDPSTDAVLFAAEAKIPKVLKMPGSLPPQMEENVSREMNMIFQFLMDPRRPPKTVSLKMHPMMNVTAKKVLEEPQEFLVGDCFCNRLEIGLKELYGGGLLHLYVSADPKHEIRRIDFAELALRNGAQGAFSLTFPAYTIREGFSIPQKAVLDGVEYELSDFSVVLLPEPEPESASAPSAEKETPGKDASSSASEEGEEKAEKADGGAKPEKKSGDSKGKEEDDDEE